MPSVEDFRTVINWSARMLHISYAAAYISMFSVKTKKIRFVCCLFIILYIRSMYLNLSFHPVKRN